MNRTQAFSYIILFLIIHGCTRSAPEKAPTLPQSGKFLLLCDDWTVDNWYSYRDSFLKYNIPLTFFVSHFHQMKPAQVEKLRVLQKDGHEIAYHTLDHLLWFDSSRHLTLSEYLRVQIDSGLELMRKAGFEINHFAFPGDQYSAELYDSVSTRFARMRDGHYGCFEYWLRKREYQLRPDSQSTFWCYAIDNASLFGDSGTLQQMIEDVLGGQNVALLFHSISNENQPYTTKPDILFSFIREIRSRGIGFNTCRQFYIGE